MLYLIQKPIAVPFKMSNKVPYTARVTPYIGIKLYDTLGHIIARSSYIVHVHVAWAYYIVHARRVN